MPSQPERIASLESQGKWHWAAITVLFALIVGVGGWLFTTLSSVKGDLQAIKQKIKDDGLGDIVAQLRNPTSPQHLQATLSTVVAKMQLASANKVEPDPEKVKELGSALTYVVKRDPGSPEAWQAAIQLVNYEYQTQPGQPASLPNCYDSWTDPPIDNLDTLFNSDGSVASKTEGFGPDPGRHGSWTVHEKFSDCTLNLDYIDDFRSTNMGRYFEEAKKHHPGADFLGLMLTNVHVTYSGGRIIPVSEIRFVNCTFELKKPLDVPDENTQALTTQLLAATPSRGNVQFPTGM
jgi:hypothetical protein